MNLFNRGPYAPTRTCPHRWCKTLHMAPVPFGLALIAFQMWNNWIYLFVVFTTIAVTVVASKMIHYRPRPRSGPVTLKDVVEDIRSSPSPLDLEMQDAKYEGTGWRMLEVRKGWARVAVGCDLVLVALIGLISTVIFANPREEAQRTAATELDGTMLISMLIGSLFVVFTMYAHKKATQPRRPKKAWLPAFLQTSN